MKSAGPKSKVLRMASVKQKGPMCKLKFISVTRQIACGWFVLVLLTVNTECVNGSHITGTWNTKDFFMFLVKFGFQKTDMHNTRDSSGYIFGNITSKSNLSKPVTFAVLDRGYFLEYYGNRTVVNKEKACRLMFNKINTVAYDSSCNYDGGEIDFLRKVPCPKNQLCLDEDNPWNVVKGHQLTFIIEDVNQPRFWYISLVACYRNLSTCQWHHMTEEAELEYDLWLVNGNPNISSYNPPVYQFSFDRQDTMELYVVFFLVYLVLVPLQLNAAMRQHHPVTRLFTASLLLEFLALSLILIHVLKFSLDGEGIQQLAVAGDILDILSRAQVAAAQEIMESMLQFIYGFTLCNVCDLILESLGTRQVAPVHFLFKVTPKIKLSNRYVRGVRRPKSTEEADLWTFTEKEVFKKLQDIHSQMAMLQKTLISASFMLLLLLLAKGWAVTRQEFTWKPLVFGIWFLYGVVHVLLYVWNMTEVDIIEDIDEYQTWPGWLIIVFRTLIMVWFLFELRNTMMYEHNAQKLNFFLHFGASALVWFIYLPIIALIALQISALWRFKLLLGITYSADCLAYCVMTHLLWPTRSEQYFLLAEETDLGDELDEFNEAPHVVNNYKALNHSITAEPPDLTKIIA